MVNEHTRIRMAKGKGLLACLTGYVESVRHGTFATSMEGFTKNKYTRKIHKFNKEFNGKKKNKVLTNLGQTKAYEVEDGLDQGGTMSPLLWRIYYDPLIAKIDRD